ncbi:hypothetical protein [Natronoarchaeum rubrum]|uniref:hypothetical protein n=1 Tax=Natronoarchaeum rubrum TaxID=755311 RepID=UPI0021118120|nr:hypothetical protein [Natronoarchaeum rubrum]
MTHSTQSVERESGGSTAVVFHTIDVTSLDSAGAETYDPSTEVGLDTDHTGGISVVGQEDATNLVRWDHINEQLAVVAVADGTDVTSGTDVGEVRLKVEGI